jgi:DNA-binding NarL/FixJ family response regulator
MNRIVIVGDHPAFRARAGAVLAADGFRITREAVDGLSILAEVQAVRPDVVLLGVRLPDAGGFEVADALLAAGPRPAVMLTSSRDACAYDADLARTGLPFIPRGGRVRIGGRSAAAAGWARRVAVECVARAQADWRR